MTKFPEGKQSVKTKNGGGPGEPDRRRRKSVFHTPLDEEYTMKFAVADSC